MLRDPASRPLSRICVLESLILALILLPASAQAAKTDVVVLNNGDRITGEIKALERGRLRYSTDAMGTIYIEWDDIDTVSSGLFFRAELADGQRFYGSLSDAGGAGTLGVSGDRGTGPMPLMDIVRIIPVKDDWKGRLDLEVGAGYSYAKASDVSTASVYLNSEYVGERRITTGSVRADFTDDGDDTTVSSILTGQHYRLRQNRNFNLLLGQAEQNDELDVDLRVFLGGGVGKVFTQSNRRRWLGSIGLGIAQEESSDGESNTDLEGILQTRYDSFLFDTPKLDLTLNLLVFPSITETGRVRSNYDLTLSKEIIEDFFFNLSFGGSYDTEPTSSDAAKSDYSITTGLSYEFL
jgi:hypothetical protein